MKNITLLTLTIVAGALLVYSVNSHVRYAQLQDAALSFQQDSQWFAMDVTVVDAETGEPIARAGLGNPVHYNADDDAVLFEPRISRVYDAESGSTRLSGITDRTLTFTVTHRDYAPATFQVTPHELNAEESQVVVELQRRPTGPRSDLASILYQ